MGLAAYDVAIDTFCNSSGSSVTSRFISRPAIHLVLSEIEVIKRQHSLFQGSGGLLVPHNYNNQSGGSIAVNSTHSTSLINTVHEISSFYGLNKQELAQVLNISRKSLYNLLNEDTETRKVTLDRIFNLLIVTRALKNSGLESFNGHIHKTILGGSSFFNLLTANVIDEEKISFAASRLQLIEPASIGLSDPFSRNKAA